jgi:hypothetical protein
MSIDVPCMSGLVYVLTSLRGYTHLEYIPPLVWRVWFGSEYDARNAAQTVAFMTAAEREW